MESWRRLASRRPSRSVRRAGRGLSPDGKAVSLSFEDWTHLVRSYEALWNRTSSGPQIIPDDTRTELLGRLLGTPLSEAYFIVEAIAETRDLRGDICEFGVAQGETSALIANEIRETGKTLHLFDSFAGLPAPGEKDVLKDDIFSLGSIEAYKGQMTCGQELVLGRLAAVGFPPGRYVIHAAMVDQPIFPDGSIPARVSFAYVDFDFYDATRLVLEYLHETTVQGAVVIVDDYDFFSTGVKTAVDEFLAAGSGQRAIYDQYVPDECFGHFAVLRRRSSA